MRRRTFTREEYMTNLTEAAYPTPAEMYEAFYGPAIFEPCTRILVEHAAPRVGEAALDLACGTGQVARRVAPLVGEQGRVTGLDLNPGMLAVARKLTPPQGAAIDWREGDAVEPDLPDAAFDLVLCQHGLQFFPDRAAALRHVRRVLRPGGRLALAVWRGLDRHPVFRALAEAEAPHLLPLGMTFEDLAAPFSLGDAAELRALLADAGFTSVELADRSIEARFPAHRFIQNMELAYAAVIPKFAEDRSAFDAYLETVAGATAEIVQRHTRGDHVTIPMRMHVVVARPD
jgi:ubiquinone/menaquinone biosynthesis C-methylase UbiE